LQPHPPQPQPLLLFPQPHPQLPEQEMMRMRMIIHQQPLFPHIRTVLLLLRFKALCFALYDTLYDTVAKGLQKRSSPQGELLLYII